jgi:hypothetical protein
MSEYVGFTTQGEETFLRDWASRNKSIYENEGSCGFGRDCVGITSGQVWIDLGPTVTKQFEGALASDTYEDQEIDGDAWPPEGVDDAYHKHDCLAVLGHGPAAVHQLYLWVKNLDSHGFVVKKATRSTKDIYDALLHGGDYVYLEKA